MKTSIKIGCLFWFTALAATGASAQSPRADISWLAGGHEQAFSVSYSPDGTVLASSGYFGDSIKLWRTSDGSMVRTLNNRIRSGQTVPDPIKELKRVYDLHRQIFPKPEK